jgi:hypothetical protein
LEMVEIIEGKRTWGYGLYMYQKEKSVLRNYVATKIRFKK